MDTLSAVTTTVVRRASKTAQSVASVASHVFIRNDHNTSIAEGDDDLDEFIAMHAKDKINISIKSTPNKDAKTTCALAIKSGTLLKRNEQGQWKKSFVCMVPHMFLYYFDNENCDSPRGVIDLHLFQQLSIEGNQNCILKLTAPPEANNCKSYYFQCDKDSDVTVLNDWVTCIHRDKYQVIRDERDAYQQLQDHFSGEMDTARNNIEISAIDKERMQIEISHARKDASTARAAINNLLVNIIGMSKDEVGQIDDIETASSMLLSSYTHMKDGLDKKMHALMEAKANDRQEYDEKMSKMQAALQEEVINRKSMEMLLLQEKKTVDDDLRDAICRIDTANLNMTIAITEKNTVSQQLGRLNEEKKVLVKEVKSLRKKLDTTNTLNDQLKGINDRLTLTITQLQAATHAAVSSSSSSSVTYCISSDSAASESILDTAHCYTNTASSCDGNNSHDDDYDDDMLLENYQPPTGVVAMSSSSSSSSSSSYPPSLKDLTWLSPEQRALVDIRAATSPTTSAIETSANHLFPDHDALQATSTSSGRSSFYSPTSLLSNIFSSTDSGSSGNSGSSSSNNRSNGSKISSIMSSFLPTDTSNASSEGTNISTSSSASKQPSSIDNFFDASTFHENVQPSDTSKDVLRCFRCDGTVEGPKYSTCKCAVPALSKADAVASASSNSVGNGGRRGSLFTMFQK